MIAAKQRTRPCSATDARERRGQAYAFLEVAELVADETDPDLAYAGVAASLAVLAGIAAADAACCAALGERSRSQNHRDAEDLLEQITPGGRQAASKLRQLLSLKDAAHYGLIAVNPSELKRAIRQGGSLVAFAEDVTSR